jgi:hypothetical protein
LQNLPDLWGTKKTTVGSDYVPAIVATAPKGELMRNPPTDPAQPVGKSTTKARAGVTGHNVRYVLGVGLAGAIAALIAVGVYFGADFQNSSTPDPQAQAVTD